MQNLTASPTQDKERATIDVSVPKRQFFYTIEGNIGCGKSTFLQILRKEVSEAYWIEQPVKQWQNLNQKNINMLEKYYQQPKRWGFTFQIYAIFTRIQKMHQAIASFPQKIKISQRSILADKFVFSQLMHDLGYMDEREYEIFKSLYPTFQSMAKIEQTRIIYLRCSPEKCYERTRMRMRAEESQIPLEYLQRIHDKHELWFKDYEPSKVLIIDTSTDFKNRPQKIHEMLRKLKEFIQS